MLPVDATKLERVGSKNEGSCWSTLLGSYGTTHLLFTCRVLPAVPKNVKLFVTAAEG